jgi:hypothetical protein
MAARGDQSVRTASGEPAEAAVADWLRCYRGKQASA